MAKTRAAARKTGEPENVSAYFRSVFEENPTLLKTRSNAEVLDRWLADHPGARVVPGRVKRLLFQVKAWMRRKSRLKRRKASPAPELVPAVSGVAPTPSTRLVRKELEALEEQIDDCLSLAKHLDREGLGEIICLLRHARNKVVWQMGQ